MSDERIPMTREGYEHLKGEIHNLEHQLMEITKRVATAREMGDLSENAEYHAAREDQGMQQAKIDLVRHKMAHANIIDPSQLPKDMVVFGSKVRVKDMEYNEEETFVLVGQLQTRMDLGLRAYERAEFAHAFAYLSQVQAHSTTYGNQLRIEVVSGLTRFHLGPPAEIWSYLAQRLRGPVNLTHGNLPLAVLLFQQAGDLERAAGLLALFSTLHGENPSGLLGRRIGAELQSIKEALAATLLPDRFAAA